MCTIVPPVLHFALCTDLLTGYFAVRDNLQSGTPVPLAAMVPVLLCTMLAAPAGLGAYIVAKLAFQNLNKRKRAAKRKA